MEAFGVPLDQISGSDWVMGQDARFDIVANVPEGTTKDQIPEMLLNLLKDRFQFTFHREKKDFDTYALVVARVDPNSRTPLLPIVRRLRLQHLAQSCEQPH